MLNRHGWMASLMGLLLFLALSTPAVAANSTVTVTPGNMDGWTITFTGGASTQFVPGPATPPLGSGSARQQVGPDGDDNTQLRTTNYAGTPLSALTALSYSTYVSNYMGCQASYLILSIDSNGDSIQDDSLFFEPCYQTGGYGGDPVPAQGAPVLNTWQTWDALHGGWWAFNDGTFGPPLITLAHYASLHPGAKIVNGTTGLGGLRVTAGGGAGAWDNFVGNADAVTVGVNGSTTTYDFELYSTPTSKEQCKNGGWKNFSPPPPDGPFKNQGACVSWVEHHT